MLDIGEEGDPVMCFHCSRISAGPLFLAALAVAAIALLTGTRVGLGMQAIREDEDAAEASGVGALRLKLLALAVSTALAGLTGGLFAYSCGHGYRPT